jgi:hypothetical protein
MKSLEQILRQLSNGEFEFTHHALRRAVERNISDAEIRQAAQNGKRIEDYPQDKYSPSCLNIGLYRNRASATYSGFIHRNRNGSHYYAV